MPPRPTNSHSCHSPAPFRLPRRRTQPALLIHSFSPSLSSPLKRSLSLPSSCVFPGACARVEETETEGECCVREGGVPQPVVHDTRVRRCDHLHGNPTRARAVNPKKIVARERAVERRTHVRSSAECSALSTRCKQLQSKPRSLFPTASPSTP